MEHFHHLVAVQPDAPFFEQQALGGNFDCPESACRQFTCLCQIAGTAKFTEAAYEEAVRVLLNNFQQIIILQAVDKLLRDDGSRDLCIIHV